VLLILIVIVAAMIVGLVAGGSFRNFPSIPLGWWSLAIAGVVLGIDAFDQPNVQESKDNTKALLKQYASTGKFDEPTPAVSDETMDISFLSGSEGIHAHDPAAALSIVDVRFIRTCWVGDSWLRPIRRPCNDNRPTAPRDWRSNGPWINQDGNHLVDPERKLVVALGRSTRRGARLLVGAPFHPFNFV